MNEHNPEALKRDIRLHRGAVVANEDGEPKGLYLDGESITLSENGCITIRYEGAFGPRLDINDILLDSIEIITPEQERERLTKE